MSLLSMTSAMDEALEGLKDQTFHSIAEAADHHGLQRVSLSKHVHDLGLATESISYSHERKFTDYEERELVDKIVNGTPSRSQEFSRGSKQVAQRAWQGL